MSGVSIGHSHPRPYSGHQTLRRCRNNEEADNIILIDVDSENFENVIIIDVPESLPKKRQASNVLRKGKKLSFKNVIYIDDDDDEPSETSHSLGGNNVNFSAGTTSNGESSYAAKNFADATVEERQYVQDNPIPVRLSKCKRTYSGDAATRNRYGLDTDSESDSSDDDYPDCELVEDTSGEVQELWEKAFFRRRKYTHSGHSSARDHDSTSRVAHGENHQNVETEDVDVRTEERGEHRASSSSAFQEQSTEELNHPTPAFKDMDSSYGKSSPQEDEATLCKSKNSLGDDIGKGYHQENRQQVPEINIHHSETKLQEDISVSNFQLEEDKDGQLHSQKEESVPSVETSIINDREKLKETDEYKRAIEEEWAARQQALLIQAEEAQRLRRLRKRRKAESIRMLDMERRQKERLEEVRNSQKKDEENMNLKEIIRADVRKELKKLEVTCQNLASLLHLLGIRVSGWPNPLPQEVQTAYRRALLTFHPDRAPKSDIRKQVEAEEKFKLINRLKEKFSPSL